MDKVQKYRNLIAEKIPRGAVVARHTSEGHFYYVPNLRITYPSVTSKLQLLKDQGLANYKVNRALDYIFVHYKSFNENNILEQLDWARAASQLEFEEAGTLGRIVHAAREKYIQEWLKSNKRPKRILEFINPRDASNLQVISALRAFEKFCDDYEYCPIATELMVYSQELKLGGTIDDIGLVYNKDLALIDLKTSNQLKNHYFFQVSLYVKMFYELVRRMPKRVYIVKLSKKDGTYEIADLNPRPAERLPLKIATQAKNIIRLEAALINIDFLRKNTNKKIIKL